MRRLYLVLILIAAFAITSSASNFQNKGAYTVDYSKVNKSELALKFSLSKYSIQVVEKDGVKYSVIDFNHGVNTNLKGYAELPMLNATLQLESDNDVVLSVVEGNFIDIKLDYPLLPSRGTIFRNQDPSSIPYVIDPASIVDKFYPENIAESAEPFVFRDTRGVNIYTYPFRYNAAKNILRVYTDFSVVVKEDFSKSTNVITVAPTFVDPTMNDIYNSLYINYDKSKFANQIGQHGEMLVIYTSRDATVIQPYITWKRERGYIVHTLQVATGTNVKTNIQNAYNANPNLLYVQLVGDWADIKSNIGAGANAPLDPDLGCVAGGDFYPELIIGRFSAESTAHVTTQINKAINYEKSPNTGSYYKNTLGIASNEGPGDDNEYDNQHMDIILDHKLLTYNYTASDRIYNNGGSTAMQAQVSADLNGTGNISGVGVINYCGHGLKTSFYSSGFSNTNINALTNGNLLPFIWSVACINGEFHTAGDCFAEAWLRKENGGAVATLMATINQPWIPPMRGQDYFNDILRGGYDYTANPGSGTSTTAIDKRTTFGSISVNGCVLMLAEAYTATDTRNTIQTWTLFGDASLQVRTDTPTNMTIGHLPEVMVGPESFEVFCNTEGAYGALTKDGVLIGAAYCQSGIINLPIAGLSIGDVVKLVVTAYNKIPYIIDLEVVSSGPYANFTAEPTEILIGQTVNFTDASGGGTFTSWAWNFGAGASPATATGQGPHVVTYNTAGLKTVSLLVNGTYERVKTNLIKVNDIYTLTISTSGSGSVLVNGNPYSGPVSLAENSTATLQAAPDAGWNFLNWSGAITGTTNPANLLMNGNKSVTATFQDCNIAGLPYTQNFNASTNIPLCWSIVDKQGNGQVWQFGTHTNGLTGSTGNYAYLNSDAYGSGNSQNADLITPMFNMSNYSNVTLSFKHYFRSYAGSSATLSYSINGGSTWTQIQQWTANTANPATFEQIIVEAAGKSDVQFKWNYTGSYGYYWDIDDIMITGMEPEVCQTPAYSQAFTGLSSIPTYWVQQGSAAWQVGTVTNGVSTTAPYAYVTHATTAATSGSIVSNCFDFANYAEITISMAHRFYLQNAGQGSAHLEYSIEGGTWTAIQSWTASVENLSYSSGIISNLTGKSNVRFRWRFEAFATGNPARTKTWSIDNISIGGVLSGSLLGDVNSDGFINILDVVWMISHLNGSTPVGFDMDAADVNEDSAVNLSDLTTLLNLILITAK